MTKEREQMEAVKTLREEVKLLEEVKPRLVERLDLLGQHGEAAEVEQKLGDMIDRRWAAIHNVLSL